MSGITLSKILAGAGCLMLLTCMIWTARESVPAAPADIALHLNDERTKLSAKADAVPGPQLLIYPFGEHTDATSDAAKFWRALLAGKTRGGTMDLGVAVSRATGPTAPAPALIEFLVYKTGILWLGAAAMLVLVAAFGVFAANSTVLR